MKKLRIALLYFHPAMSNAQTILDHAGSLARYSRHEVTPVSLTYTFGGLPATLDLDGFDVVVIHYTIIGMMDRYLGPRARAAITRFDGLKAQFIQDEYRFINDTIAATAALGIDVLFTCVPQGEIEKVYSSARLPGVRKVPVLTGYVPEDLTRMPVPPIAARPVDVGYRARRLPYWLGALGVEKFSIAEGFLAATHGSGLACDISCSEGTRLYGGAWTRFLTSCKTMLGVESGSSVFDFTGDIQRNVEAYVAAHPGAGFEEVRERFFAQEEGRIRLNQISPRCFETAALRTGMVLFEGEYSGILEPWRHYLPLRKDFSNIEAVLEPLRSPAVIQQYVDRTFDEVARNPAYSYARFVGLFDEVIEQEFESRIAARRTARAPSRRPPAWRRAIAMAVYAMQIAGFHVWFVVLHAWQALPERWRTRLRPMVQSSWEQVRKLLHDRT